MTGFPTVSVVIPVRNRAHCIGRAIRSIIGQTIPVHEIIIVDDASTDNTVAAALSAYSQCRIVHLEKNRGAPAARAEGIRSATGEWIAFLDSDDWWLPQKLEWQLEKAGEGFDVIHGNGWMIKDGEHIDLHLPRMEGNIYATLLTEPGPMLQCLLVRRHCFAGAGFPDASIRSYQEWDTSLALARHYPFGFVDKPLFVYEIQEDSISQNLHANLFGYEQIVRKWWNEIRRVAGSEAGYSHYQTMARMNRSLHGLAGEAHYLFLGARLSGLPRSRALGDFLKNRLRSRLFSPRVFLRKIFTGAAKSQP